MKLQTVTTSGLKGQSRTLSLAGVDVVSGPNGAGKTTVLLAVKSGVMGGRFPFLPDDCQDFVQVGLGFDGFHIQRTLSPEHSASVMPGASGIKKVETWVAANIGAVQLGVCDFLSVSPGAREQKLLGLVRGLPAGVPQTRADLVAALPPEVATVIAPPETYGQDVAVTCAWLAESIKTLGSAKNLRERDIKTVERSIADLANVPDEVIVGTLAEAKATESRLQGELATARGQLEALQKLGGSARDAITRAEAHERKAQEARDAIVQLPTPETVAAPFDARLAELKAQLPDNAGLVKTEDEARREVATLEREGAKLGDEKGRADRDVEDARLLVSGYETGAECPSCGRDLDETCRGHEAAKRQLASALERQADAQTRGDDWAVRAKAAAERHAAASQAVEEAAAKATPVLDAIATTERERTAALEALRQQKHELATSGRAAAEAAKEARAALASLPADVDPELLTAQVEGLEIEIEAAGKTVQAHQRSATREEERSRWTRQKTEQAESLAAIKGAISTLTEWRSTIVTTAAERLVGAAERVCSAVFPGLRFVAVGTDKGTEIRLVREEDGKPLPLEAWAESEALTFAVAVTVALMEEEGAKWKCLLIDEAQKLDPAHLAQLVAALATLVEAGRLDNALLAGALTEEHIRTKPRVADSRMLRHVKVHRLDGAPVAAQEAA